MEKAVHILVLFQPVPVQPGDDVVLAIGVVIAELGIGELEDGSPMGAPPLLQALAFDPILGDVKLIAEAWWPGCAFRCRSTDPKE